MDTISLVAEVIHSDMMDNTSGESKWFTQSEVQEFRNGSEEVMTYMQELIDHGLVRLSQRINGNDVLFAAVPFEVAERTRELSDDEAMVYQCIENTQREGVWVRQIKSKTQLHEHVVTKALKILQDKRLVKRISSVKHRTRRIYMLYHLEPSAEVSGGPWYIGAEIDNAFIDGLLTYIWSYVSKRTFPQSAIDNDDPTFQASFPATYNDYSTVDEIHSDVETSGILQNDVRLSVADIRQLCELLVYNGTFERVSMGSDFLYKATRDGFIRGKNALQGNETEYDPVNETPCSKCTSEKLCEANGIVNSTECVYLNEWCDNL